MACGVDWGSVDNADPNPEEMRDTDVLGGVSFAYIRKLYPLNGQMQIDGDYNPADKDLPTKMRAAGIKVGAYLFPAWNKGYASPQDIVDEFADDQYGLIIRGADLPPAFDLEFPGGSRSTGRSYTELADLAQEYVEAMYDVFGIWPVIYTGFFQVMDSDGLNGTPIPWAKKCPLWIKTAYRLPAGQPPDPVVPPQPHVGQVSWDPHDYHRIPNPWRSHWINQFQGDCRGYPGIRQCDLNRFNYLSSALSADPRISWVQERIRILGAPLSGPLNVTGTWDADTEHAIEAYQISKGCKPDKIIGPDTFASLAWEP